VGFETTRKDSHMPLVLERKDEQAVVIRFGEHRIVVRVVQCRTGRCHLLFDGDREIEVLRSELDEREAAA
jgi:sRNA-binding carbon storage regulator CsrA